MEREREKWLRAVVKGLNDRLAAHSASLRRVGRRERLRDHVTPPVRDVLRRRAGALHRRRFGVGDPVARDVLARVVAKQSVHL